MGSLGFWRHMVQELVQKIPTQTSYSGNLNLFRLLGLYTNWVFRWVKMWLALKFSVQFDIFQFVVSVYI